MGVLHRGIGLTVDICRHIGMYIIVYIIINSNVLVIDIIVYV